MHLDDTIVATASPPGRGGIGIVRLGAREAHNADAAASRGRSSGNDGVVKMHGTIVAGPKEDGSPRRHGEHGGNYKLAKELIQSVVPFPAVRQVGRAANEQWNFVRRADRHYLLEKRIF